MPSTDSSPGHVALVGAGPGAPGLITLRGVDCLAQADVVLYDYLVNPRILEHARPGAELLCLGRHGHGRIMPQAEINERMIRAARGGKSVVRLKAGDPAVFARVGEEIEALGAAGIAFEIVPGITAALAAGSHAGIPLTHRDFASAVALVTGHEDEDKHEPVLDYGALAGFPGTLVFYMGVTSAPAWTRALIERGKPLSTPVAIIRRCSWPDQVTIHTTLAEAAAVMQQQHLRPPVIVIVGDVAAASQHASWFATRLLFGKRVLVTRPSDQANPLRDELEALGAEVLVQPAIEISDPEDWSPVDAALASLASYDWLVFSSSNGVERLLSRLLATGGDLRRLGSVRIAAIGPGTAEALAEWRLKPDLVPVEYRAEALADSLATGAKGRKFLLARASRGREMLAERLRAAGATVDQVVVYRSSDVAQPVADVTVALEAGCIDWITVTSSAIARSLGQMFGANLKRAKLVSISPVTSATLRELGYEPAAEAKDYTMSGVVAAICAAEIAAK